MCRFDPGTHLTPVAGLIFEAKIERYFLESFSRERNLKYRSIFVSKISPVTGVTDESERSLDLPRRRSRQGLVVNEAVVDPFEEKEEGSGIPRDVAESGHPRSPDSGIAPGTAISPISGQQNNVTHTHTK